MTKALPLFACLLLGLSTSVVAQQDQPDLYDIAGEFAFVRINYNSYYGSGYYGGPWLTDFPAADENFLRGVARLTNVRVMSADTFHSLVRQWRIRFQEVSLDNKRPMIVYLRNVEHESSLIAGATDGKNEVLEKQITSIVAEEMVPL